jgi:thymidylate synthase
MDHNYKFKDINEALPAMLHNLLEAGYEVGSRAGRTMEMTHVGITFSEPWHREILVEGRKPNIAAQIFETMWVLAGRDDMESLTRYLPRAADYSDDGETWRAGYGKRIRKWPRDHARGDEPFHVDQLAYVVSALRSSSLTRQAVISIWDPAIDTEPGKDIPCNDWITFSNRNGKLDMHVGIRSNDAIWGWSGINQFEWSTLLEIVAHLVGVQMGSLHFSTTSFHVYDRHWAQSRKIIDTNEMRVPQSLGSPRFELSKRGEWTVAELDMLFARWFQTEYDIRTGSPLADAYVEDFPEPMLRSWLRVLQWWWGEGNTRWLLPLKGTALELACQYSVQPKRTETHKEVVQLMADNRVVREVDVTQYSPFILDACRLHTEKDAAYGDSWKRRGEMLGILANIARKIDRLGKGETSDETSADTAMDLMIYLAKYRTWLTDPAYGADARWANELLKNVEVELGDAHYMSMPKTLTEEWLTKTFDRLEDAAKREDSLRYEIVDSMLVEAYRLARHLWLREKNGVMTDAASVGGGLPGSWSDEYRGADAD